MDPVEDYVCETIAARILQQPTTHLSLHFDGVREKAAGSPIEDKTMKEELEKGVYKKTGYVIQLKRKVHYSFLEYIAKISKRSDLALKQRDDQLLESGNCIACALSYVGNNRKIMRQFVLGNPPTQHTPNGLVVRAYADFNLGKEFTLHPSQSLPKVDGDYVVHAGGKGKPHAIFC